MLPEFPRAYDAIQKVWNRLLFDAAGNSDPLISQVMVRVQREGHRAFLGESETEYKRHSVSYQWKPEIGKGMPTQQFFELPMQLGRDMAMQQAKGVFAAMEKPSAYIGKVSKEDGPFTFDLWLTKMDSFEIDFDQDGKPKWPQWFLSQEAMDEFRAHGSAEGLNAEQSARLSELVRRKRQQYDERENRRRLVD